MSIVYNTGLWGEPRQGVGAFYFDNQPTGGIIGTGYFGNVSASVSADLVIYDYSVLEPIIDSIVKQDAEIYPNPVFLIWKSNFVHDISTFKDIEVDFVGVPRIGSSPLVVDFTATVKFSGPSINYQIKQYKWYFDYGNYPATYEISLTNVITHVFSGYYGQKFTVKCVVELE
jgi:hypothetical protein